MRSTASVYWKMTRVTFQAQCQHNGTERVEHADGKEQYAGIDDPEANHRCYVHTRPILYVYTELANKIDSAEK